MKFIYCLMSLVCPYLIHAQQPKAVQRTVVDKVAPNIAFNQMYNYQNTSASLYDFRSKLLIVDFWAGYCTGCLHKFPLLDSLQQLYPRDLKVLLISSSARDKLSNTNLLFKRIKSQHPSFKGLPVVLGDSTANSYFEHQSIPHYVWLDENFKIVAITGTDDITAEKISAYLEGASAQLGKKDQMDHFDLEQRLFIQSNGGDGEGIIARSTLTRFIPGLGSRSHISYDNAGSVTKMIFTNQPVTRLLMTAYSFYVRPERIRYASKDSSLQILNRSDDWVTANSYTYELITPPISQADAFKEMQQDLHRLLKVSATIDTLLTDCYILDWDSEMRDAIDPSLNPGSSSTLLDENGIWHFKNVTISQIAEALDARLDQHVFADSKSNHLFNIDLPDEKSWAIISQSLQQYGLALKQAQLRLANLSIHKLQN